jgi:ABC-type polysaccharide/polyol phosphate transport system ATPase subunit
MSPPIVRVEDLSKLYRRMSAGFPLRTLKSALLDRSLTSGLRPEETVAAVRDVSFTVEAGESVGIIGSNGSGKSTLLKVLSGILQPTSGSVVVDGSVAALIELGAGFHPEISGRENIYINGAVLGLGRRELDRRFDEIVEFSGLGDFIDEPVKNYSSGMYVRLGFSVAVHVDPDVLMVDEVLAVGDEAFAHRCLRRLDEFLAQGKTIIMVSHSLPLIEEMCDRVLWLERGSLEMSGSPRRVCDAYRQFVSEAEGRAHRELKEAAEREREEQRQREEAEREERAAAEAAATRAETEAMAAGESGAGEEEVAEAAEAQEEEPRRWGSRAAEIVRVRMLDGNGEERYHFHSGEPVVFAIEAQAASRLDDFVFGVAISTPRGIECWGTNTYLSGLVSDELEGDAVVHLSCPELRLAPGEYLVDVAVHAKDGTPYDYHTRLLAFTMTADDRGVGVYFPRHRWEFSGGVRWKQR